MASALPDNSASFSLEEVLAITGGTLAPSSRGASPGARVERVVTDSRADVDEALFVALKGERFDAHDHAAQAARGGARVLLLERDLGDVGAPCVLVSSTLAALGALAAAHRRRSPVCVVAIAGSAGKTTTRSAVGAALELAAPGVVHQTTGNLNNQVGVPLVLFGLRPEHRYAVVELGTNAPGEVERLAAIAAPDVAVLTLIGIEHSEGLGDLDGIEAEEGALFARLGEQGIAIGNGDDARVRRTLERAPGRKLTYGFGDDAFVRGVARAPNGVSGQRLTATGGFGRLTFELSMIGEAGAYAALAALAVLEALSLSPAPSALARAFASAGEPGRLQARELADGTVVLDDAYNANPASALASLRTARELALSRRARLVVVLGEMRELGAIAAREHARVGEQVGASGAALLIAVGGDARLYVDPARAAGVEACFAADAEAGLGEALRRVRAGDVVLVKASRGVRAELVVEGLVARGAA